MSMSLLERCCFKFARSNFPAYCIASLQNFLSENLRSRLPGSVYTTTSLPCLQGKYIVITYFLQKLCAIMQKLAKFKVCNPTARRRKIVNQNVQRLRCYFSEFPQD